VLTHQNAFVAAWGVYSALRGPLGGLEAGKRREKRLRDEGKGREKEGKERGGREGEK